MTIKMKGICAVFGGFLIHLTLGTFYTIGNMNTYIVSYMRKHEENNLTYSSAIWINTAFISGMGIMMFFAGILDRKVGTSITCAIGCSIFTVSTMLTYFSVKYSFISLVFTYGFIPAIGTSFSYASPLVNSMKWFPENRGIVTGITVGGFGLGALIFDQIQTLYLNPNNYSPKDDNSDGYFVRDDILNKVPFTFILLGSIYAIIQLVGIGLIFFADKYQKRYNSSENIINSLVEDSQDFIDITPRNALKTSNFYILWIIFALGNQTVPFINTLYKPFGQTFINDDHYLANVGSVAAIFNASGRIFWGKLMDKYNFKDSIIALFGLMSILMFTFSISSNFGKIMYSIWIYMIFFSFSGIYSLFPAVILQRFGPSHANTIYGMLFMAPAITGVLGAFILEIIVNNLGWFYSFCLVGFMSVLGITVCIISLRVVFVSWFMLLTFHFLFLHFEKMTAFRSRTL